MGKPFASWSTKDLRKVGPVIRRPSKQPVEWHHHADDDMPGWGVCIQVGVARIYFPTRFAREQDAIAAARAIENVIDWEGSGQEIMQRISDVGIRNVQRIMMEALQW